jgi:hypothetical protein
MLNYIDVMKYIYIWNWNFTEQITREVLENEIYYIFIDNRIHYKEE